MNELTIQLGWNRLLAIVEEQAQVLMRTAFSTVVREAGDLSAGVFNRAGDMLAQAVTGTPGHVNSMADAVRKFLVAYPLAGLVPGDVLITNDPWDGTGHLNDFTVVTPVFVAAKCVGLFASTSHIADVGGRGFGPDANDVFEEGIRIPITHLFRAGVRDETLMSLLKANVRDPIVMEGDLYSLTACNDTGAAALLEMLVDLELQNLEDLGAVILQRSKSAMLQKIAELPQGSFDYSMRIDGYDEPLNLCAQLTVTENSIEVDFAGTSPVSSKGINVPLSYTQAYASFGVRCVVGNEVPNNAGSLGVVEVRAPEGCIVNALPPRAVSARHAIGQMLPDVVLGCLQQVLPNEVPAEGASCIWNPVFMHSMSQASNENATDQEFVINPIFNGGTGARPGKDGLSTTAFPSGVRTTSSEVNEATSPLIIWQKEYTADSGGAGKCRGGLGQTISVEHRQGSSFVISKMFDRIKYPARGRQGGEAGSAGRVYTQQDGGVRHELGAKGRDLVPPGHRLVMQTPGGGGIGDPSKRSSDQVSADLQAGIISANEAVDTYKK
ncbi:MAG: hydantoinase B/oxoprolinase family protein [Gammaproteobacteria bacterium]|nr:hydantoinase B/oxoprolinase family protein [Gammaproteobacteria bacterium]